MKNSLPVKVDCQQANYMVLDTMIRQAMQQKYGRLDVDYDLVDQLARDISQEIPSDVILESAKKAQPQDILNSQQVKHSQTSQLYDPEYKPRGKNDRFIVAVIFGIAAIVALVALIIS